MNKLIRVLWAIQKELHTIASCMESKEKYKNMKERI